jgi:hypothetical protein
MLVRFSRLGNCLGRARSGPGSVAFVVLPPFRFDSFQWPSFSLSQQSEMFP